MLQIVVLAITMFCWIAAPLAVEAQDPGAVPVNPRDQIEAVVQSYETAFNQRDVEKLVSHWSPEGVYLSRVSGEQVVGHAAMTKEFSTMFAGGDVPKLKLVTESIDLVSPNVALETGSVTVVHADQRVVTTGYRVVFVQRNSHWLIDRVSEEEIAFQVSNYDYLQGLEWLIGDWVEQDAAAAIKISTQWTKNKNFISRTYTVTEGEETVSSGLQIIGWDAAEQQIRSWLFDSEGGVITGKWTQREDQWVVSSVAQLNNGLKGSFTSVFRPIADGKYGWQKVNRMIDGNLLPNVDEVIVVRK
jgi:uncharacterized protein (TIGR02246 family)